MKRARVTIKATTPSVGHFRQSPASSRIEIVVLGVNRGDGGGQGADEEWEAVKAAKCGIRGGDSSNNNYNAGIRISFSLLICLYNVFDALLLYTVLLFFVFFYWF